MKNQTLKQLIILGIGVMIVLLLYIYDNGAGKAKETVSETETLMETERAKFLTNPPKKTEKQTELQTETETETEFDEAAAAESLVAATASSFMEGEPIRVLICGDDYDGKFHDRIELYCTTDFTLEYGENKEEHRAEEVLEFGEGSLYPEDGKMILTPKEETGRFVLKNLKRSIVAPSYAGTMEIRVREEGILLINTLPLEEYLCSVVPSEMPAYYEMEALKAQAICARTYAMRQKAERREAEYDADVDDSVSYQVYNNQSKNESTTQAVMETVGQVLMKDGELAETYYYSTSCGIRLTDDYSDEAVFCSFMTDDAQTAFEEEEPWYRWKTYYSLKELTRLAKENYNIGDIKAIEITERETNGCAKILHLTGSEGETDIEGEYAIRKFLQTDGTSVILQNGKKAPNVKMLPSGFFYLTKHVKGEKTVGYMLNGGGYGHGKGMSQNGARHMAAAGYTATDILRYYYGDAVSVTNRE